MSCPDTIACRISHMNRDNTARYQAVIGRVSQSIFQSSSVPQLRDAKPRPLGNLRAASGGPKRAETVEGNTQAVRTAAPCDSHSDCVAPGQPPVKGETSPAEHLSPTSPQRRIHRGRVHQPARQQV